MRSDPADDVVAVPASFSQQRLWFLDELDPGRALYNIPIASRIAARLEVKAIERALRAIVARHETLRTTFTAVDGQPMQVIAPYLEVEVPLVDVSAHAAPLEEATRLAAREASRPFDLRRGPLVRCQVVRLAPADHVLLLTLHHIIADGWSMSVLFSELQRLYDGYARGLSPVLPPLAVQYADFAAWQRRTITGDNLERLLAFWRRYLDGAPTLLELPTDRPRPAIQLHSGAARLLSLPAATTDGLRALCQRSGATLFMGLLVAYATLLARYAGSDDVVIGTPIANRVRPELESLIGFFVNTLALRVRVPGSASFREVLAAVRQDTLDAYAHQDLPFEKLVEELRPDRTLSHNPLFQAMLILQNAPGTGGASGASVGDGSGATGGGGLAKFDLILSLTEVEGALRGSIEYRTDLFDADRIDRMVGHLEVLLDAAIAEPDRPLREFALLTAAERRTLLDDWNQTTTAYPRDRCVHGLFRDQVARTPEAVAVEDDGGAITYAELDRRSDALAHRVLALGVGPEQLVAICADRSIDLVVAMLAVLKAGAAYLPLEATYPRERVAFMLEDAGVAALLVHEHLRDRLPAFEGPSLALGGALDGGASYKPPPAPRCWPDGLAYVMYTSGSTGRPKGGAVMHRGLVRLVRDTGYVRFAPGDRVAQASNASFDPTSFEVWGALLSGATLVVVHLDPVGAPAEVGPALRERRIDLLFLSTAVFHHLAREAPGCFTGVRHLFFGGEQVDPAAVRAVIAAGPPARMTNGYGPTECSVFTCTHDVDAVAVARTPVPIGAPISNTSVYVLDASMQPVPIGVTGELFIGGDGLGRGYVARPALTAATYVPDPFSPTPGARLYRTGDLVRWRTDGVLEYHGRADHQVKIRGHRVELGEIEQALRVHPGVADASVIAIDRGAGDRRLAAYLMPEPGVELVSSEVRAALAEHLPAHMVPAHFTVLPVLPLTANGKVDRRALPAPADLGGGRSGPWVAPRTQHEYLVAAIWREVLAGGEVGVHDDFFQLGGHSLLATQVMSRLKRALGVSLPLRLLFEHPTVESLAAAVAVAVAAHEGDTGPAVIRLVPRDLPVPLSFAQERLWFIEQLQPGTGVYHVPAVVMLRGAVNVPALSRTLDELVRRHASLRTTFQVEGGRPWQRLQSATQLPLVRHDLRALPADRAAAEASRLLEIEVGRTFDLTRGPLIRACLITLATEEHCLGLVLHHIVCDGWSMGVLLREVEALYQAFSLDRPSPLPELAIQYVDFAAWQRRFLDGAVLHAQLAYWRGQLAGAPAVLELPADRPRPAQQSFRGEVRTYDLPPAVALRVRRLTQERGVTPFMVLVAAFNVLLGRLAGRDDVVIGTPIANRTQAETEPLIGLFVNTLAIRTRLDADPSFNELLVRVREVTLGAYAHQDLPFERLVEELRPERSLSHSPLFQVMFVLQNTPSTGLGDGTTTVEVASRSARFDLTLSMAETAGGMRGSIEYSTDLFDGERIDRLWRSLVALLDDAATRPAMPISRLTVTDAGEVAALRSFNDTATDLGPPCTLDGLIAAQVARTPARVAVRAGDTELTFAGLWERSGRLAARLRASGVGPEVPVAVCLDRSCDLSVALVAILRAGGAYVPLDPDYPADRLRFMVADCAAPIILAMHAAWPEALDGARDRALFLDDPGAFDDIAAAPEPIEGVDHAAYVIFTSGSTGRPKGAINTHRAIVNRLRWMQAQYRLDDSDHVLQKTPISFDVSVWELFWPLITGATLVYARPGGHRDPAYLAELIERERITTLHFVPSMLRAFLDTAQVPPVVRRIICSGEALAPDLAARCLERSSAELHNLYGPTEAAVDVTAWACTPADCAAGIPIGRPIANTQIHVLDRAMQPVPRGVPGELYIGGVQVGRGYLGRPGLTAERFVPDPWGPPGARLYRTGDLARRRGDGVLEYLGRNDHQEKLRGFRIELEEIEVVLRRHPAVASAACAVRQVGAERQLVAYLVPTAGAAADVDIGALRAHLAASVPEYMVPARWVTVAELPLGPSGKIDRRALPDPGMERRDLPNEAPRGPIETVVAEIWSALLGVSVVGRDDDFFALGGHSLLATQLVSRLREQLRVELPLRAVFDTPRLAGLAAAVELAEPAEGGTASSFEGARCVFLERDGERRGPLSPAQRRIWFLHQLEPTSAFYNMPAQLSLTGAVDVAGLEAAVRGLVGRHEILRARILVGVAGPEQACPTHRDVRLTVEDVGQLDEPERSRRAAALIEHARLAPFDLARDPLIRATLVRIGPATAELVITLHHLVCDGWSIRLLLHELTTLHDAWRTGLPPALPPLTCQYLDFVEWERSQLTAERRDQLLAFWVASLTGAPPLIALPGDRPRPPVQTFRGADVVFRLGASIASNVRRVAADRGATPFVVLLSGLAALLSRLTGQPDVVIGTPVANRTRVEHEPLIGLFANTLALRVNAGGDPRFADLVDQTRAHVIAAQDHQALPFEMLVDALKPERTLGHNPIFQVMFAYQTGGARASQSSERVALTSAGAAKFDLTFSMVEAGDGFDGILEYSADLFDQSTAVRFVTLLEGLLAAATAAPDRRLTEFNLAPDADTRRVLADINVTERAYPDTDRPLHHLLARQAAMSPDAIAASCNGIALTYAELHQLADRIAAALVNAGVGRGDVVGVAVAPSVEQIAALIGVLKAGAAFLPLDVERPASYRAAVCAAALPAAVVVRGEPAPGPSGHTIIDLAALPACADVQLPDDVTGDDAAYVIFTSGSSGEPKGVLVQHRAIVNHTAWMQETWPLNGSDAVLHRTSIGFDASIWEVFSPLAAGARLIVADADTRRDIQALLQLISDASVTVMQAVPSLLAALVREPAFGACPTVRRIFAGGEQLSRELVDRLLARSAAEVVNLYGPTEATIDATTWTCHRDDARAVIPIGRPIANVRVHVLDAHGAPVPIGVVGELYLGGTALAYGYWQRPAMTAERFVPDHLGEVPGQRLYRTGDLVRLRIDGALELVGRADDQIKIRGHRVELGEVEAGLRALDGVDDAAVVVAGNGADVRLVAFVTGPAAAAASALRDALRVRLLEAMVPAVVLGLDALPVTGSGKIDRRALLAQVPPLTAGATARRPHTALERRIADVWSEVMERRLDDVEANFFELGGNSLLAMQVISRLRSQLGYTVTLRTLFEAPTVAALATRVGRDIDGRELTATPVSPAVDRSGIEAVVARVVAGAVGDPAIEVTGVIPETTWAGRVASQISATLARYFELPALVTPPAPTVTELAAEILVALAQRGGRSVTAQLEGWLTELEDIR